MHASDPQSTRSSAHQLIVTSSIPFIRATCCTTPLAPVVQLSYVPCISLLPYPTLFFLTCLMTCHTTSMSGHAFPNAFQSNCILHALVVSVPALNLSRRKLARSHPDPSSHCIYICFHVAVLSSLIPIRGMPCTHARNAYFTYINEQTHASHQSSNPLRVQSLVLRCFVLV